LLGFTFAQCAGFALGFISATAAGSGVIMFQAIRRSVFG